MIKQSRTARVLLDTGPLVAIMHDRDQHHDLCVAIMERLIPPMLTCWPVLTEAAWLLKDEPRAVQRMLKTPATGLFEVVSLGNDAFGEIAATLHRYTRLRPQLADAALLYLANREQIQTIFTLDRRDFSVFRLANGRPLRLLPA